MEFILEIAFQFIGEVLLQVLFQFLAELGFRSLAHTFERPRNVVLSTIGFAAWGAIAGGISLLILSHSLLPNPTLRAINLVVSPILAGTIMMVIGMRRSKRGRAVLIMDRFFYAFVFAFSMSTIRFLWAE